MAACVSRELASSGTAVMAASSPASGDAAISSIARSVAAMNAAIASRFDSRVALPTIRPLPGSGVMSSTRRIEAVSPVRSSCTGSLLSKPVAAWTAPCVTAAP